MKVESSFERVTLLLVRRLDPNLFVLDQSEDSSDEIENKVIQRTMVRSFLSGTKYLFELREGVPLY